MKSPVLRTTVLAIMLFAVEPSIAQGAAEGVWRDDEYFPPPVFEDLTYDDGFKLMTLEHFRALDEPPLSVLCSQGFALRASWLSSFFGDAFLIITREGNGGSFSFKRFLPGRTVDSIDPRLGSIVAGSLDDESISLLMEVVDDVDFFALDNTQSVTMTDGVLWVMEVCSEDRYHAVYGLSRSREPLVRIAETAAEIAGVKKIDLME